VDVTLARAESARHGGGALVAPVLGGGAFAGRHRALAAVSPGHGRDVDQTTVQCGKHVQRRTSVPHASHAILAGKIINLIVICRVRDALVWPLVHCNMESVRFATISRGKGSCTIRYRAAG